MQLSVRIRKGLQNSRCLWNGKEYFFLTAVLWLYSALKSKSVANNLSIPLKQMSKMPKTGEINLSRPPELNSIWRKKIQINLWIAGNNHNFPLFSSGLGLHIVFTVYSLIQFYFTKCARKETDVIFFCRKKVISMSIF